MQGARAAVGLVGGGGWYWKNEVKLWAGKGGGGGGGGRFMKPLECNLEPEITVSHSKVLSQ